MYKRYRLVAMILTVAMLGAVFCACREDEPEASGSLQWRNLTWAVGAPLPEAKDFLQTIPEGYSVRFAEQYAFDALGDHSITVITTDPDGKEFRQSLRLTLIEDTQAPVIVGAKDLSVCVGDGISYRTGVSVSDNCDTPVTLTVDSSAVDSNQEGSYPVTYTATDGARNVTEITVTVYVYREAVTKEMLWGLIDPVIAQNIPTSGSRELKARAIYNYVYSNIAYSDTSDKNDWVRAAYEGQRTGKGDCFTYFALSKAFFERLGMDNMDIHRTEGLVTERHYWNLVNIGSTEAPRWYHFDACRIRGESPSLGCLMTDAQLDAYSAQKTDASGVSNYFYAYNRAAYPATDVTVITPTAYD